MLKGMHKFRHQDVVAYGQPAAEVLRRFAEEWNVRRLLIITTSSLKDTLAAQLSRDLGTLCVGIYAGVSAHSPRECVLAGAAEARRTNADLLVALGGGSATDATKVMQLCLWADLDRVDQLDDYRFQPVQGSADIVGLIPGIRMVSIPTTLSAGDFTDFAGVSDSKRRVKEGYFHPQLSPKGVILDPALTLATPPQLWFSTGLRAVDHSISQICSPLRAPYADTLAIEGLRRVARGLAATQKEPNDLEARLECQLGMWLAINGAVTGWPSHAIGHTLGGSYGVPHGFTSCVILPAVLAWTAGSSKAQQAQVSELLGAPGQPAADVVRNLVRGLGLPDDLKSVGIGREHFQAIAEHTMLDRAIRTSPRPVSGPDDVVEILEIASG